MRIKYFLPSRESCQSILNFIEGTEDTLIDHHCLPLSSLVPLLSRETALPYHPIAGFLEEMNPECHI